MLRVRCRASRDVVLGTCTRVQIFSTRTRTRTLCSRIVLVLVSKVFVLVPLLVGDVLAVEGRYF